MPKEESTPAVPRALADLTQEHLDVLRLRAIPAEAAGAYGLRNWNGSAVRKGREEGIDPFPKLPAFEHTTGILIPYPSSDDHPSYWRVRHDETKFEVEDEIGAGSNGRREVVVPRYVALAGPVRPFITHSVRRIAANPTEPIFVTEAPLKALSLEAAGFPAIGLGGVLAGMHDVEFAHQVSEILVNKDLKDQIDWRARPVYVVFDAGQTTNPLVALGVAYCWRALSREGALVRVVTLPYFHPADSDPENGKMWRREDQGPDDLLARQGCQALRSLIDQAVFADPVERVRAIMSSAAAARDKASQVIALTQDLVVQACLHAGGARSVAAAAAEAPRSVGVRVIKQATAEFAERLSNRANGEQAEWKTDLERSSTGRPLPIGLNVEVCLRGDPRLSGLVAYDEFQQAVVFGRTTPWADVYVDSANIARGDPWTDADTTRLQAFLGREHQLLDVDPRKIEAALFVVARDKKFHPVREYLLGLEWDGTPRLDTALEAYFGAPAELSDYHSIISSQFFIAAVARALRPGCKVDTMLVLEGDQGDYKTTALKTLAGTDWYGDASQRDLTGKEAAMNIQGCWIYIFDEGSIFARADALQLKEFLSKEVDQFVPKFSNRKTKIPRGCVFGLTTNDDAYLSDPTGNRRYRPVACGRINIDALIRDRDQLWAEARHRFEASEKWWCETGSAEDLICQREQDKRRRRDPWEQRIGAALADRTETTVEYVLTGVLDLKEATLSQKERLRVVGILQAHGWRLDRVGKVAGASARIYTRGAGGKLEPTRKLTPSQQAMASAFSDTLPVAFTHELLPSGKVIRVWREREPEASEPDFSAIEEALSLV
ncbi:MAG: VapE domain-containing protein [Pseudomonadota bacterium]